MQADITFSQTSPLQYTLLCILLLAIVLLGGWFCGRAQRESFKLRRAISLMLLCLATSLPFAFIAYSLWPWDFDSLLLQADISLAIFAPLVTAYVIGITRKRTILRKMKRSDLPPKN